MWRRPVRKEAAYSTTVCCHSRGTVRTNGSWTVTPRVLVNRLVTNLAGGLY